MNAEKPDDVLADLEAKHGCAAPSGYAALERIQKLCDGLMGATVTLEDSEAYSDAMWTVIKQVAEICAVELARKPHNT